MRIRYGSMFFFAMQMDLFTIDMEKLNRYNDARSIPQTDFERSFRK